MPFSRRRGNVIDPKFENPKLVCGEDERLARSKQMKDHGHLSKRIPGGNDEMLTETVILVSMDSFRP
jgi:hypothetical protein